MGQLRLRGDVIIRCYQLLEHAYLEKRELMFSTQFHTCAVTDKTLSFNRSELDYACDGKLNRINFFLFISVDMKFTYNRKGV